MPLPDDAKILSVDDHVIEHPGVWQDRLPSRYKEAGPKVVEFEGTTIDALGNTVTGLQQTWEFEGRKAPTIGLNAVAGKPKEEIGLDPVRFDEMRPGCYDITARLRDMDEDGIHAQMCFPSFPVSPDRRSSWPRTRDSPTPAWRRGTTSSSTNGVPRHRTG